MEFSVERYRPELAREWDAFVDASRNGTFLLKRGYMDYHADRFHDCSYVARKGSKIVALLPANITGDTASGSAVLHSHQGLTYGGWILPPAHLDGADLIEIFRVAIPVWREAGINELDYKAIPTVYHRQPSEEDEYALWRLGAVMTECTLDSAVDLRNGVKFNTLQRRHLAKSEKLNFALYESNDVKAFIKLLADCLRERHDAAPVHTVAELSLLRERFPQNIRIFAASLLDDPEKMQAAVCIYDTDTVAHAQYIATTPRARELNLLTPLFYMLMTQTFANRNFFDFGISTEQGGHILNEGLLRQKFSLGATGIAHRRFSLKL